MWIMGYEQVLAGLRLSEFSTREIFIGQVGISFLTLLMFFAAIALCVQAFRAIGAAKEVQADVDGKLRSIQELASEVRHLTAQVEKASVRVTPAPAPTLDPEVTPSVAGAMDTGLESSEPVEEESPEQPRQTLDAAKRAATEPVAILRSFMRQKNRTQ